MTNLPSDYNYRKSSRKRRIAAFIIDHFVMTFLIVSAVFLLVGPDFVDETDSPGMALKMFAGMFAGLFVYMAKDSIHGISAGKWVMGIMVRDESDVGNVPSFGRLFLRNLLLIIWPVEFIILAVSKEKKRIGDAVAKTIVVKNPNKPARLRRVLALIGFVIVFAVFLIFFSSSVIKNSDAYGVAIDAIEKNERIIAEAGGIKGYGMMPGGNISVSDGSGEAAIEITVLGNKQDVEVSVYLEKEPDGRWTIIDMQ